MASVKEKDTKTLIVVHLSSMDSYADLAYEKEGSYEDVEDLSALLAETVLKHDGPVIIVDQGWLLLGPESKPRSHFLNEIDPFGETLSYGYPEGAEWTEWQRGPLRDILWIWFDEQDREWKNFFKVLDRELKKLGTTSVELAGFFYERDLSEGCVSEVFQHLRNHYPTEVSDGLVGCVSHFYGPEEDLPGGYTRSGTL